MIVGQLAGLRTATQTEKMDKHTKKTHTQHHILGTASVTDSNNYFNTNSQPPGTPLQSRDQKTNSHVFIHQHHTSPLEASASLFALSPAANACPTRNSAPRRAARASSPEALRVSLREALQCREKQKTGVTARKVDRTGRIDDEKQKAFQKTKQNRAFAKTAQAQQ